MILNEFIPMQPAPLPRLLLSVVFALCLPGCTTIENRRDLYFPQCIWGPYTKILHHGVPKRVLENVTFPEGTGNGKNVIKPQG